MKSRNGIRQGAVLAAAAVLPLFAAQVPAATQAFKPPQPRMIAKLECGGSALKGEELNYCIELGGESREGWVYLGFMVDKDGKPAEIAVIDSTGNANYEQVAMRALERSTFEPALLDGQPINSAYTHKFKIIDLSYRDKGVANNFATGYKAVVAAIEAGDRSAADAAMARL
jgi:TonB family protein